MWPRRVLASHARRCMDGHPAHAVELERVIEHAQRRASAGPRRRRDRRPPRRRRRPPRASCEPAADPRRGRAHPRRSAAPSRPPRPFRARATAGGSGARGRDASRRCAAARENPPPRSSSRIEKNRGVESIHGQQSHATLPSGSMSAAVLESASSACSPIGCCMRRSLADVMRKPRPPDEMRGALALPSRQRHAPGPRADL